MDLLLLAMSSLFMLYFLPALYMFFIFFIMGVVEFIDRLIKKTIDLLKIVFDIIINFPVLCIGLVLLLFRRYIL